MIGLPAVGGKAFPSFCQPTKQSKTKNQNPITNHKTINTKKCANNNTFVEL